MKNNNFCNFLNFGYWKLFQVCNVQKSWGNSSGNILKSVAHFFDIQILRAQRFIVIYLFIEVPRSRKNNENWEFYKNVDLCQIVIVTRLHSPKIIVINLREHSGCWCLKSGNVEISWFWTHFGDFQWIYWQNSIGFSLISQFSSNFRRLVLHDYWTDFKKFGHF